MSADGLDVLLIEDNPGDARLIQEMLRDVEDLLRRVDATASTEGGARIHHERRLSAGIERLSGTDVDVVLLDLGLPDSTGLDTLAAVTDATGFVPIVVLTGLRDEEVGVEAIQRGAQDYLVKGEVTSDLLARSIHYAIERNRQERERARQLEQLESLNRLNRIGQDITHAVITTSTREDLERAVCERLVDSDAYRFAWIGGVAQGADEVTPRVAAGAEDGYLDEVTITVDDETGRGPTGKAIHTHEVQVVQSVRTDSAFDPWREAALERGFRSSAAIPLVYEETLYGVLNVYAGRESAFGEQERAVIGQLGEVVGHAINAIERKNALMSDEIVEVEFNVPDIFSTMDVDAPADAEIQFGRTVGAGEDTYLVYGTANDPGVEALQSLVDGLPHAVALDLFETETDATRFELQLSEPPVVSTVAAHGGYVESATITDGDYRLLVHLSPGTDVRQIADTVQEAYPMATVVAQRQRTVGDDPNQRIRTVLTEGLTDRQRTTLEAAFFSGYFEWPRESTGEEVAESLGISAPTFAQHLRAAQRKLFEVLFVEQSVTD